MLTEYTKKLVDAFQFIREEEAVLLQMHAELIPVDGLVVNIGAGVGTSALAVLEKRPDLTDVFYTVDIQKEGHGNGSLDGERTAFDNAGLKCPNQIHGDSFDVGKNWSFGKIDFLIIDGDHSEEAARNDILTWEKHLKKNAIVFVHDYHEDNFPQVVKVVNELMFNNEKYKFLDRARAYVSFVYIGEQEK